PGLGAGLLARPGVARGFRRPLHRVERPLPARRPAAALLDQLRHRPRRLHPARPRLLRRQAQRGQLRRQRRGDRRQPLLELWGGGGDRRRGGARPARPAAALDAGDAAALPGCADAARRRRDVADAGGQQQPLVRRLGADLVRLGAGRARGRPRRLHPPADHAAEEPPGAAAGGVPDRGRTARQRPAGRLVVPARRPADDAAQLAGRRGALPRRLSQRDGDPRHRRRRRADHRRQLPDPLQCRQRPGRLPPADAALRRDVGGRADDGRTAAAAGGRTGGAAVGGQRGGVVDGGAAPGGAVSELRATYRLQLGPNLNFEHVRELVPYLKDLGVSHVYLSPSFQAREGSTHGYDVIDPTKVSDALGGEEGLRALSEAGLGIVLDIVPNHMAAVDENRYWADEELRKKYFDL